MTRSAATFAVCLCLAGCTRQTTGPRTYQLTRDALTPPAARQPVEVSGVKGAKWSAGQCRVNVDPFSLDWKSDKALLRSALKPSSELNDAVIAQFREAVVALEAKGCLNANGSQKVLDAFVSMLTAHPRDIYTARWGNYYQSSALDIQPQFRIKVTGPLLKAGTKDARVDAVIPDKPGAIQVKFSDNLEGFETAQYRIVGGKPDGVTVQLISVEQNRAGKVTPAQSPVGFALDTSETPRHIRLLFLRRASQSDRDITLLSAPALATLEAATSRIQTALDAAEQCRAEREATCQLMPPLTALNLELLVTANGREVSIPVGGTVHTLIQATGMKDWKDALATIPTLAVERPWRGRMVPVTPMGNKEELLRLVLIGGEKVTW